MASALFTVLAITDFFDGYLARKNKEVTNFGKLMDPIADKVLVISALIILTEKGMAASLPVVIISVREIFISGWRAHLGAEGKIIAAGLSGKAKTVMQVLAVLMLMLEIPFGNLCLWIAMILSVYSGVEYIHLHAKKFGMELK